MVNGLTDTNLQFHAYAAIKKAVEKHEANSGSAIILKPNGEILASIRRFFSPPENILMGAIACLPVNKNWRK
jgi:hypothetical protein